jgi:hypothetical protein
VDGPVSAGWQWMGLSAGQLAVDGPVSAGWACQCWAAVDGPVSLGQQWMGLSVLDGSG